MKFFKSSKFVIGVLLAIFFAVALFLRVYLPYDKIFVGDWVKLSSNDAYYHMRLIDVLVRNFPHFSTFDPYLVYPGGQAVGTIHFFNWLLGAIIWLFTFGSASERTVDVIGAYFPAVMGALMVIPVYFIGKELFGRAAGIVSAALIAIIPGEYLGRSILGFTDNHIAEVMFSTVAVLFLILAIKTARQQEFSLGHLTSGGGLAKNSRLLIYSLLAGIFLGIYVLTWLGALLFVFILAVYFIIQAVLDHLKGRSTDYLGLVGGIFFFVALVMSLPARPGALYVVSLVIAFLIPMVLNGTSRLLAARQTKPAFYPVAVLVLGLVGLVVLFLIRPSLVTQMVQAFGFLIPKGASLTTIEMQPILFPGGTFTWAIAWGNFTTGFFLSFIGLGALIYLLIRHGTPERTLLVVWSLIILLATLVQRRFAYYFAVNVALLSGYLSWQILELTGIKESIAEAARAVPKGKFAKRPRQKKGGFQITVNQVNASLAVIIIFFVIIFPNIEPARLTASEARFAPSDGWVSSLTWMRENTPDPFGNPDFYYRRETGYYATFTDLMMSFPNQSGNPDFYANLEGSYKYPSTAYGVMAWWDYGYWITRIARRIPNANPGQDPRAINDVARFFTSQNETAANEIADRLGSAYVVIDHETATSKFWAIATWAGKSPTEFFDVYLVPQQGGMVAATLFYPEYYRALSTRLYNFDGKAVTPTRVLVISYENKENAEGKPYKEVDLTRSREFATYEEAEAFRSSLGGNARIVGLNPLLSPVPLPAVEDYKLAYSSNTTISVPNAGSVPEVKVFQHTK